MFYKKILAVVGLLILFIPNISLADGGVFPPADSYITETDQKAVLIHEKNTETMILSVNFKGDPENFGWVIPTPAKPEVTESSDDLFTNLKTLTTPKETGKSSLKGLPSFGISDSSDQKPLRVEVIETKKIDLFDISIITSDSSEDLTKWLSDHSYNIPNSATKIFDDYISKKWYFVCVKIDMAKAETDSDNQLKTGHGTPLKFLFESDKIIFPMKLTSIISEYQTSSSTNSNIKGLTLLPQVNFLFYVFSDNKKELSGFDTNYANWVKKEQLEGLAKDSDGNPWYESVLSKMYLTKFSGSLKTSEMKNDLEFTDSSNNEPVGVATSNTLFDILIGIAAFAITLIIILLSPLGLIFLIFTLVQFYSKSNTARVVAWIFQILSLLTTLFVAITTSVVSMLNLSSKFSFEISGSTMQINFYSIPFIAAVITFLIVEIIVIIWQYKYHKVHPTKLSENCPENKANNIFQSGEK